MKYTLIKKGLSLFLAAAVLILSIPMNIQVFAADTESILPAPTVTLDFLPEGIVADVEKVSYTSAVINTEHIELYKSLDSGAEGIEISVEKGTVIDLITKYVFNISDTETLEFYRYDYFGSNEILSEAALSEYSGYVFIYGENIEPITQYDKTDAHTGVSVSADIPEGTELSVIEKNIDEIGFDSSVYRLGNVSLFYDVTLYNNGIEYQPENGVTVTFPENAILEGGFSVGDIYYIYHIHDDVTDVTGPYTYNGGDISADFDNLSIVGIAEAAETIDMIEQHGEYTVESLEDLPAVIKSDSILLYDSFESNVYTADVSGIEETEIEVFFKVIYEDGFILYQYAYYGNDADFIEISETYQFISSVDISINESGEGTDNPSAVDAEEIYSDLINIATWEDWQAYWEGLDEESVAALENLSEEKIAELERLDRYYSKEKLLSMAPPAVNYTHAAPLVSLNGSYQPISPMMYRSMTPMTARTVNSYNQALPALTSETENGLILNKSVIPNGDKYTITLEAYTTGTVTAGEATPNDIILVLDLSTSMTNEFSEESYTYTAAYPTRNSGTYYLANGQEVEYCSNCRSWTYGCSGRLWHNAGTKVTPKTSASDTTDGSVQFYTRSGGGTITRLDALKSAMTAFVSQVADQPSNDRIALVGFHTEGVLLYGNSNASALVDATANEAALLSAINGIGSNDLDTATEHGRGMERAVAVFNAQTDTDYSNRNKVVIMVTDGEPAPSGTNDWSSRTVKQAIEQSYILKNTHNATVYTVSVMPGTDASNPTTDMDKYMDYMSSNYPSARYTANSRDNVNNGGDTYYSGNTSAIIGDIVPGSKAQTDGSYYLSAGDLTALNEIFGNIAEQTGGAAIELDATTQIKDIISPYFTLPENADVNDIAVSTMDAVFSNGVLGWKDSTITNFNPSVDIDGRNVTVNGFDFSENFVAETGRVEGDVTQAGTFHGRKLIISFDIEADPLFLGGDNVPTNGTDSGVYDKDGNLVENFNVPHSDVPLKEIENIVHDKHVYYTNTTDLTELLDLHVKDTSTEMDLMDLADGVNNAYVNLVYSIVVDDVLVATYTIEAGKAWNNGKWETLNSSDYLDEMQITENTEFSVTCDMISINNSGNVSSTNGTANVYIYKPVLTFADSEVYYQEAIDFDENYKSTVWKNGTTVAGSQMEGTEPELALTYHYESSSIDENGNAAVKHDIPVSVTVIANAEDITNVVSFQHIACNHPDCGFDGTKENFIVHILLKETSMTIIKQFPANADYSVDENQSFLFRVSGTSDDGTAIDLYVTINGAGSVKIEGLPWGTYTIEEITDWSWRYLSDVNSKQLSTVDDESKNVVVFTNTRTERYWLSGDSINENQYTVKPKEDEN